MEQNAGFKKKKEKAYFLPDMADNIKNTLKTSIIQKTKLTSNSQTS